jgi:hypothetical protein
MTESEQLVTIIPTVTEDFDEDNVITVLLWDGTTSGVLSPSAAISFSEIADINTSLQAAANANLLDNSVERGFLRGPIVGAPIAVSSSSCDMKIVKNLAKLKVPLSYHEFPFF